MCLEYLTGSSPLPWLVFPESNSAAALGFYDGRHFSPLSQPGRQLLLNSRGQDFFRFCSAPTPKHTRLMTQANPLRSASPLRQSKDNLVKQALDAHFSQPRPVEPPSDEEVRTLLSKVRLHHILSVLERVSGPSERAEECPQAL